jgi:hypothetical protein
MSIIAKPGSVTKMNTSMVYTTVHVIQLIKTRMTIRFAKAKIYQNHHNWSLLCIKSQPNCKQILNKILIFKKIKTYDLNQTTLLNFTQNCVSCNDKDKC